MNKKNDKNEAQKSVITKMNDCVLETDQKKAEEVNNNSIEENESKDKNKLIKKYENFIKNNPLFKAQKQTDTASATTLTETNSKSCSIESNALARKAYKDIFDDFDPFANPGEGLMRNLYDKIQKTESKYKVKLLSKLQNDFKHTIDVAPTESVTWESFKISDSIIKSLNELGFEYPSPVQVNAIPNALNKKDLLVRSKNGTGKTLSYVIPILELLSRESTKERVKKGCSDVIMTNDTEDSMAKNTHVSMAKNTHVSMAKNTHVAMAKNTHVAMAVNTHVSTAKNTHVLGNKSTRCKNYDSTLNFALILVPTRELSMQVGKVFRKLTVKEEIMSTFGGSNYYEDILRIKKGVSVIVGTPGRVMDLCNKNVIKLERFRVLVFDEADKILASDFSEEIDKITKVFNSNRVNMVERACDVREENTGSDGAGSDNAGNNEGGYREDANKGSFGRQGVRNIHNNKEVNGIGLDGAIADSNSVPKRHSNLCKGDKLGAYESFISKFMLQKQIFLLSATFPVQISSFVRENMRNVEEVNLMPELFLLGLGHHFIKVCTTKKLHCLFTLLKKIEYNKLIIFCNSISSAEKLGYRIIQMGHPCYFFHSALSMDDRKLIFHRFTMKESEVKILIGTDLITRGIDIPEVNCVVNFEFPKSVESFLHRVGRAGRFGTVGISISLVNDEETDDLLWVEKQTGMEIKGVTDLAFQEFLKK